MVGHVEALYRYPVKSMAGLPLQSARLGWYGIEGDRRLALRRLEDRSGMPWLTASRLPSLILYQPVPFDNGGLPAAVRTPEGKELPLFGDDLAADVAARLGAPVEMMHLRHGIFDETPVSIIAVDTAAGIERLANVPPDLRRFRANLVLRLLRPIPFEEDKWLGGELRFGDDGQPPAIAVTMRDERCAMVNLDPVTAKPAPEVMKTIVRVNQNYAGVYGAVTRTGRLAVGQVVTFAPAPIAPSNV